MNNSQIKYCVLFFPENKLDKLIKNYKNEYKNLEDKENYFNHPPHLSFYLFNSVNNKEEIISQFKRIAYNQVKILYDGWKVFENDQNSSKDTVVMSFKNNSELKKLQFIIAKSMNNFRFSKISYKNIWNNEYEISYNNWGYPFVGNHWIPHITIGSIPSSQKFLTDKLIHEKPSIDNIIINKLTLCSVDGNTHKTLSVIKLNE